MDETPSNTNTPPKRRRILRILAVLCLIVGALFIVLQVAFRSSGLFKATVAAVQTDQAVIDALGEPLEPGMLITGNLSLGSLSSGTLNFSVTGPRGGGQVSVAGLKGIAEWNLLFLTVLVDGSDEPITVEVDDN